jgi:hypothetical protein
VGSGQEEEEESAELRAWSAELAAGNAEPRGYEIVLPAASHDCRQTTKHTKTEQNKEEGMRGAGGGTEPA